MDPTNGWDFRDSEELLLSSNYEKDGYVIRDANNKYLALLKKILKMHFLNSQRCTQKKPHP